MPAQVLLQACDTSALSDIGAGEWLTVAPAFLAGGSREVIATLYPTPDRAAEDDPLVSAAVLGTSLSEALSEMQERSLSAWEGGTLTSATDAPIYWGAYAPVRRSRTRPGSASKASSALVSRRFVRVLGQAIKESREGGGKRLHSGFLLSAVLDESGIADLLDGAGNSFRPWAFLWSLGPYICSRFLRISDGGRGFAQRRRHDGDGLGHARDSVPCRGRERAPGRHPAGAGALPARDARRQFRGHEDLARLLSTVTRRRQALTDRALLHILADAVADGERPGRCRSGRHLRERNDYERLRSSSSREQQHLEGRWTRAGGRGGMKTASSSEAAPRPDKGTREESAQTECPNAFPANRLFPQVESDAATENASPAEIQEILRIPGTSSVERSYLNSEGDFSEGSVARD